MTTCYPVLWTFKLIILFIYIPNVVPPPRPPLQSSFLIPHPFISEKNVLPYPAALGYQVWTGLGTPSSTENRQGNPLLHTCWGDLGPAGVCFLVGGLVCGSSEGCLWFTWRISKRLTRQKVEEKVSFEGDRVVFQDIICSLTIGNYLELLKSTLLL